MDRKDYTNAQSNALGFTGHTGFIGKWQINRQEYREFESDLWCEGTSYRIMPFRSTTEQFQTRCFMEIVSKCEGDWIGRMNNFTIKQFYLPMVKVGKYLVSLHSQVPEINFDFLNGGSISVEMLSLDVVPFNPQDVNRNKTEFLAIWLSLADVGYCAHSLGETFDINATPEVIFVPVHYLTYEVDGMKYTSMALGDANMSNYTLTPLPEDEFLLGHSLKYSYPRVTMSILFIALCGISIYTLLTAFRLWNTLDWSWTYKVIALGIPIFLTYLVAWWLMIFMLRTFKWMFLKIEKMVALKMQRSYIKENLKKKISDLNSRFSYINIGVPNVESFGIDISIFDNAIEDISERLAEVSQTISRIIKFDKK